MKTFHLKGGDIKKEWHLIDVKDEVLGRTATKVANILMGKGKVNYSPHLDMGDYVVIINAKDVKLTGLKREQKVYISHSGYPGGLREVKFEAQMKKDPRKIIEHAVSGMLPDNRLKDKRLRRLKIFSDEKHTYADKFVNQK